MFQLLGVVFSGRFAAIRGQIKQNRHPSTILRFPDGVGQYADLSYIYVSQCLYRGEIGVADQGPDPKIVESVIPQSSH